MRGRSKINYAYIDPITKQIAWGQSAAKRTFGLDYRRKTIKRHINPDVRNPDEVVTQAEIEAVIEQEADRVEKIKTYLASLGPVGSAACQGVGEGGGSNNALHPFS